MTWTNFTLTQILRYYTHANIILIDYNLRLKETKHTIHWSEEPHRRQNKLDGPIRRLSFAASFSSGHQHDAPTRWFIIAVVVVVVIVVVVVVIVVVVVVVVIVVVVIVVVLVVVRGRRWHGVMWEK